MRNLQTDVPLINVPLASMDGRANPIWFQFFIQLWRRTGEGRGSSVDDLRLSDIDIDADLVDADLRAAIDALEETNTIVQSATDDSCFTKLAATVGDINADLQLSLENPDLPKLASTVKDIDTSLQTFLSNDGISQQQASLLSKIVEFSMMLEEAQDVYKKLRQAINDMAIDELTPIDSVGSMAYQDASSVKIKGGSIDGTSIGATTPSTGAFTTISATGQITSTLATGTSPFSISSTTVVPNLNVSQLLGNTWAIPGAIGSTTPNTGAFTTLSATGQISSTLATGTAPFSIASTTVVPNLNVSQLLGATWAAPGTIGSTTPNTGAFTTLTASQAVTLSPTNANVTMSPTGTGLVTINPATTGAMDNVNIGATTAKAGTFTQLSIGGLTTGIADFRTTTGATLVVGRTSNTGVGSQPGAIGIYAPNASGTVIVWGQWRASITNATAGTEACSQILSTRVSGAFVDSLTVSSSGNLLVGTSTDGMTSGGSLAIAQDLAHRGTKVGFYNTAPTTKQTITGSRGGNAALASLLTGLANIGLITDSSTA